MSSAEIVNSLVSFLKTVAGSSNDETDKVGIIKALYHLKKLKTFEFLKNLAYFTSPGRQTTFSSSKSLALN